MQGRCGQILGGLCLVWLVCQAHGAGFKPLFSEGEDVEVFVYTSKFEDPYRRQGDLFSTEPLHVFKSKFGWDIGGGDAVKLNVTVPSSVKKNQTHYFAHVFMCKEGIHPNPWAESNQQKGQDALKVVHGRVAITRKVPEIHKPVLRKLLSDPPPPPVEKQRDAAGNPRILPYWAPRVAIFIVTDTNIYPEMSEKYVSPFVLQYLFHNHGIDRKAGTYSPVVHIDELGSLSKDYLPINETAEEWPLEITLGPLGSTRFEWMLKMEHSVQMHREMGTPESEMEEVRRMFVETNSWLLLVTIVVSIVHLLFDCLAFKNDISFWRDLQSTKGISVRSIVVSTAMEFVVMLYLMDNETSLLVLFTVVGGLLVNVWKVARAWYLMAQGAAQASSRQEKKDGGAGGGGGGLDEQAVSRQIDAIASQYLLWCLGPPIVGYAVYSLLYEQHKGWYSWALLSGVNVVYAVGFMMMTPQLFLNYKYKSVEHLPWRALVYRALNTFIDDLFAFVIHMPGLHRMSVFRDDIVFFIYLYQRWIYRKRRPSPEHPEEVPANETAKNAKADKKKR